MPQSPLHMHKIIFFIDVTIKHVVSYKDTWNRQGTVDWVLTLSILVYEYLSTKVTYIVQASNNMLS